jgi:hypothetical protein
MPLSIEDQKRSKSVGHEETKRVPQGSGKSAEGPERKKDKHGLFGRLIQKHSDKDKKIQEERVQLILNPTRAQLF